MQKGGRDLRPTWGGDVSDDFDADAIGVGRKSLDVGSVSGEDRASWFGDRDDECIDGGAGASESAELGGPAGDVHADGGFDDARLQEAVSSPRSALIPQGPSAAQVNLRDRRFQQSGGW